MVINASQPSRISWTFDDLVSADAHALRLRFSASIRIANTEADRRIFAEIFRSNGNGSVTTDQVVSHFETPLRAAALREASAGDADAWITDERTKLQNALIEAAKPVAFACGLEFLPPFQVEVESPTLLRQKLETVQRRRAEERAAGQVQHLQRATELLKQFQEMQKQSPSLSAGGLLDRVNSADRGLMLQTLLMAAGQEESAHKTLWAVAGSQLVRVDPSSDPPTIDKFPLTDALGPLRSVQAGELTGKRMLLIGARSGVIAYDPQSNDSKIYRDDSITSQLGFNRVVANGEEIWACHGEAGVVGWKTDQPDQPFARHSVPPVEVVAPATNSVMATSPSIAGGSSGKRGVKPVGPRNLQVLNDVQLLFSVGNELRILNDGQESPLATESRSEIIAITPFGHEFAIVHQDGTIAILDATTLRFANRQHRAGGVTAAAALPFLNGHRILLANESGPIDCVSFDDPLLTQYLSPHRSLRTVAAAADFVVGISSDRQRLILWQTWDGQTPIAEIHLTALTRHRIADVEFC